MSEEKKKAAPGVKKAGSKPTPAPVAAKKKVLPAGKKPAKGTASHPAKEPQKKKPVAEPAEEDEAGEADEETSEPEEEVDVSSVQIPPEVAAAAKKGIKAWYKNFNELKDLPFEEIYQKYLAVYAGQLAERPDMNPAVLARRASIRFKNKYKRTKVRTSNASKIVGNLFAGKGSFDTIRGRRQKAIALANINPTKAAKQGLILVKNGRPVKRDGHYIPIENRKTYPNWIDEDTGEPKEISDEKRGKELPAHQFIATYLGLVCVNGGPPELRYYQVRGKAAAPAGSKSHMEVPIDVPVEFAAFEQRKADRELVVDKFTGIPILNGFPTEFVKSSEDVLTFEEIFESGMLDAWRLESLSELQAWVDVHAPLRDVGEPSNGDYNSFFVVTVNVVEKNVVDETKRSVIMTVSDESLDINGEELGYTDLTAFVPIPLLQAKYESFGEDSEVNLLASASVGWKRDPNDKKKYDHDENGDKIPAPPVFNVWAIGWDPEKIQEPRDVDQLEDEEEPEDEDEDESEENEDIDEDVDVDEDNDSVEGTEEKEEPAPPVKKPAKKPAKPASKSPVKIKLPKKVAEEEISEANVGDDNEDELDAGKISEEIDADANGDAEEDEDNTFETGDAEENDSESSDDEEINESGEEEDSVDGDADAENSEDDAEMSDDEDSEDDGTEESGDSEEATGGDG